MNIYVVCAPPSPLRAYIYTHAFAAVRRSRSAVFDEENGYEVAPLLQSVFVCFLLILHYLLPLWLKNVTIICDYNIDHCLFQSLLNFWRSIFTVTICGCSVAFIRRRFCSCGSSCRYVWIWNRVDNIASEGLGKIKKSVEPGTFYIKMTLETRATKCNMPAIVVIWKMKENELWI